MHIEKVTYTDYNGVERTESYYFNYTKAELTEMELCTEGGLAEKIQRVVDSNNQTEIIKIFKDLVLSAYGKKSDDGRRFIKSDEIRTEFEQTPAYSEIFMKFAFDSDAASKFINNVVPEDLSKQVAAKQLEAVATK